MTIFARFLSFFPLLLFANSPNIGLFFQRFKNWIEKSNVLFLDAKMLIFSVLRFFCDMVFF